MSVMASILIPCSRLLGAQLPQGTEPGFEVVGPDKLAVSDGLNIDTIPGDEDFLDVELHVGDGFGKASDHFDRGIAAPAFAGQIAPARLVVRGEVSWSVFISPWTGWLNRLYQGAITARAWASVRLCAEAARGVVSTAAAATS
jgi:hypothetical protein